MRQAHEDAEDKQLEAAIVIATSIILVGTDVRDARDSVALAEALVDELRKRGHLALVVGRRGCDKWPKDVTS